MATELDQPCPVCLSTRARVVEPPAYRIEVDCDACGSFSVATDGTEHDALSKLGEIRPERRERLSRAVRARCDPGTRFLIVADTVVSLLSE